MEFEIPVTITNVLEKEIAAVFSLFDHIGTKVIDHRDVGIILRVLGCCPTEENIQDIVNATQFTEFKGNIHLAKFLAYVCPLLIKGKMKPASPEILLRCFQFLDPDGLGYLEKDYFVNLMRNEGESLSEEELKEMLSVALDPVTGEISYEYYINQLRYSSKDSIYNVAAKVEEERIAALNPVKAPALDLSKYK